MLVISSEHSISTKGRTRFNAINIERESKKSSARQPIRATRPCVNKGLKLYAWSW